MGNHADTNFIDLIIPFIFMIPAFAVAIGTYLFYRKNGYVADKIVDDKNNWLYRKVSARRLGKRWKVGSVVLAAVMLVMAGLQFFVDDFAINHFLLVVASPIMMVIFVLYMILLLAMNRKKDDEEERG